jgi:putative nucleotidyltransferase with HDIG domain/PAS domain S-box-containing protein
MDVVTTKQTHTDTGHANIIRQEYNDESQPISPVKFIVKLIVVFITAEIIISAITLSLNPASLVHGFLINLMLLVLFTVPSGYFILRKSALPASALYKELKDIISGGKGEKIDAGIGVCKRAEKPYTDSGSHDSERGNTREMLMQAKYDWEYTFDTIPDAITIHDRNYNIIRANKAASSILKIPEILNGRSVKCYKHYHSTDSPPEGCPSCKCMEEEEIVSFEVFEPHLELYLEIMAMPRYNNQGDFIGIIHIAKDISYKKETEQTIQDQIKRLSIANFMDKAIAANLNLNSILHILTDLIRRHMNIDAANVLLYNRGKRLLHFVAGKGFRSDALKYTNLNLGESIAGRCALERKSIFISDLREEKLGFDRSRDFAKENFVSYISVPLIAKDEIKGVLELFHRSELTAEPDWLDFLDNIANQAAIAIDNASMFEDLQKSKNKLVRAYDSTIAGWSHALDMRDKETEGHSSRVAEMTVKIAREIGIEGEELDHINRGAYLHDIGKMAITDNILLKPGKLTAEERTEMELHTSYAHDMLKEIKYLEPAIDIPLYHHEKWDGTGYPKGIKGEQIPQAARIFAVVDVWDALSSDRPYRKAWPQDKVISYIRSEAGTHFDPEMVEVFMKMLSRN